MGLYGKITMSFADGRTYETDIFQGVVRDAVRDVITNAIGKQAWKNDYCVITKQEDMTQLARSIREEYETETIVTVEYLDFDDTFEQRDFTTTDLVANMSSESAEIIDIEDSPLVPRATKFFGPNMPYVKDFAQAISNDELLFGLRIANLTSIKLELE